LEITSWFRFVNVKAFVNAGAFVCAAAPQRTKPATAVANAFVLILRAGSIRKKPLFVNDFHLE
jgi:hypothetical protein